MADICIMSVQAVDINSRSTNSHYCVKEVVLVLKYRFLGDQKDWVGPPLFLAAE